MENKAFARQASLPAAVHRATGALLSLAEWKDDPAAAADPAALSPEQQIALVSARWRGGDWDDIEYGTEGTIGLDRAIKEIEAQSDIGRHLLAVGLRAAEMAREHAAETGGTG